MVSLSAILVHDEKQMFLVRCTVVVFPCAALVLDALSAGLRSPTLRGAQHCLMTLSVNSRPPLRMSPRYWTRDPTTTSLAQVTEQFNRTESNPILHSKLRLAGPAASITAIRIRKAPPSRRYATMPDARRAYFPIQRPPWSYNLPQFCNVPRLYV